MRVELNVGKI